MVEEDILFDRRGVAGIVTLNRPRALNAVTRSMVGALHRQLAAWANDPTVERVVMQATGEKAFSAGGDIRQLRDWGMEGNPAIRDFYREEYRLNTFIKRYPKPYVALVDGIVMGGGVGISIHGSHRVAGPKLTFAMPETGIGLFPDVGGTHFLPRLPHRIGTWLGLTGARLGQADAVWCGLATHAASSETFARIEDALTRPGDTDAALSSFAVAPQDATLPDLASTIARCFDGDSVEDILQRLKAETGPQAEWAQRQAAIIAKKSPTSLRIALRQMRYGKTASFEDCMKAEFRIVSRVIAARDFFEGVRAVIIDKDNAPQWNPPHLDQVSQADIDAYFAPLPDELSLEGIASP